MGTTPATQQAHHRHTQQQPIIPEPPRQQSAKNQHMIHTPYNGTSPVAPADIVEGITQIMNQVTNNNKRMTLANR